MYSIVEHHHRDIDAIYPMFHTLIQSNEFLSINSNRIEPIHCWCFFLVSNHLVTTDDIRWSTNTITCMFQSAIIERIKQQASLHVQTYNSYLKSEEKRIGIDIRV